MDGHANHTLHMDPSTCQDYMDILHAAKLACIDNYQDSIQIVYLSTNSSFDFMTSRTKKCIGVLASPAPVLPTPLPCSLPTKWGGMYTQC